LDRKSFLSKSSLLAVAASAGWPVPDHASESDFGLHFAPHIGMFAHHASDKVIDQINFMAEADFTAFEDNNLKSRPVTLQKRIGEALTKHNMVMGVFVAHSIGWNEPNLTSDNPEKRKHFLDEIESSVEVAKRVNARWMTVVPGKADSRLPHHYQMSNVIEALKQAASILEPHNLTIVIEPLNNLTDHPGQFLTTTPQAYQICRSVDSPSCKILYDIYHQQITEGNLIPNINYAWDEIAYFQVGDNPGRNEPGTGEINFKNVFSFIKEKGFTGVVGMEHGNSMPGIEGEKAVIHAYKQVNPS